MRFMKKESNSACLVAFMKLTILDKEAWPKSHVTVIKGSILLKKVLTLAFSGVNSRQIYRKFQMSYRSI